MNNPVESVIKILKSIVDSKDFNNAIKKEAKQAIDIIEANKLYDLNFDMSSEEKTMGAEAKAWLNMTTEAINDTSQWFERDLDDFLKEIHREDEEIDNLRRQEEEEERILPVIELGDKIFR